MPRLTRWYIKSALLYFVAANALGVLLVLPTRLPAVHMLSPVYVHLLVVGWLTQLIFGVVWWLFPAWSRERPHGHERLGWATYALLNSGLLIRAVAEPAVALGNTGMPAGVLVLSALLQWLAGVAFVANTWGRVKAR